MLLNPKLYEINTRVLLRNTRGKLSDIPQSYFVGLKEKGINIIWLMGIWKTCKEIIPDVCFTNDLINAYNKSLKDWTKEDVIGSPYSIDKYEVDPDLGNNEDILALKQRLNKLGLKLFLDFVPNHFSVGSAFKVSSPQIFLQGDSELLERDPFTYFKDKETGRIFAHGRDPLFPAWQDTLQVNFFHHSAREFLYDQLLRLCEYCDGIRCDMAMLPLNNVFNSTWVGALKKGGFQKPAEEFWKIAIKKVKDNYPDFIFFAEAYWDLEWDLQQLGFDFTYDKRLADRLAASDINGVKLHLQADLDFQQKSARFIENHDEPRAAFKFGKFKSLAAATIISTIPGLKFYHQGQFEGKKIKLPVQLGREPDEKPSNSIMSYYNKLFSITKEDIFTFGSWRMLTPIPAGSGNFSFTNFFAWEWSYKGDTKLVVINYSELTSQCRIQFDVGEESEVIILEDHLNDRTFERTRQEILNPGLFVELKGFGAHIFSLR